MEKEENQEQKNIRSISEEKNPYAETCPNRQLWSEGFRSGYSFNPSKGEERKWISVEDSLPKEVSQDGMCYENEDLVIIKWEKHNSYEFAALTRIGGALIWDIPDHGLAEMSDVKEWMHIATPPQSKPKGEG